MKGFASCLRDNSFPQSILTPEPHLLIGLGVGTEAWRAGVRGCMYVLLCQKELLEAGTTSSCWQSAIWILPAPVLFSHSAASGTLSGIPCTPQKVVSLKSHPLRQCSSTAKSQKAGHQGCDAPRGCQERQSPYQGPLLEPRSSRDTPRTFLWVRSLPAYLSSPSLLLSHLLFFLSPHL